MKKLICVLLALLTVLLLTACGAKQAAAAEQPTPQQTPAATEEPAAEAADEADFAIPEEYAAMVTITINPEFQLYLDENQVILSCVPVNDDAKALLAQQKDTLTNKPLEQAIEVIVSDAVDLGFLTEEKQNTVSIEVTEVRDESYPVQECLTLMADSASAVLEEKNLSNGVELSLPEEVQQLLPEEAATEPVASPEAGKVQVAPEGVAVVGDPKAPESGVCPDCGGTGFVCPNCGQHQWESCFCCKGTGYQTCTNCKGSTRQTCPGCKGSGSDDHGGTCSYCGGSGGSTCEVCGGAGGYTCSRCFGFTYACPTCEYAVQYCPTCH